MNYPKNFLEAIKSPESVLFIGSGISMWSGLPHWEGLLKLMIDFLVHRGLSEKHRVEIQGMINKGDLLTAASLCASKMRDADLSDFIENTFIKSNPGPHNIHELIIDLGPTCFITTNYDELIEDIFYTKRKSKLAVVNNDQPAEQAKLQKSGAAKFIFKIHGSINSAKTIVLSKEGYRRLVNENRSTIETLKFLFASRPIIYLGFGLRDPDFQILKDEISSTFHGAEREHFAIMADIGELEAEYWKREYGINIITYETAEKIKEGNIKIRSHERLLLMLKNILTEYREDVYDETESLKASLNRYFESLCQIFLSRSNESVINISVKQRYDLYKGKSNKEHLIKSNVPINEVLNSNGNLVVIGSPGTGKTNSVQRYTYSVAKLYLNKLRTCNNIDELDLKHSIPVLLSMKEYKGDLRKMIENRLPSTIDVDDALEKGWFTVIFDAVNEAPRHLIENEPRILYNNLQWLTNMYSKNRFVVTSRSMNYIQFLDYPVYEVQPLNYFQLDVILSENFNDNSNNLPPKMKNILLNPLFLSLYIQLDQDKKQVGDIKTLLEYYLQLAEKQIIHHTNIDISVIHQVFANLAYDLVDKGIQTIETNELLLKFQNYGCTNEISEIVLQNSIKSGIMVTDVEGGISFFHQTITEFLAAFSLLEHFNNDPFVIEEKIKNLKWNETLVLFVGLLEKEKARSVLRKIANTDILFAVIAFQSAAIKEGEIGSQLFRILNERIQTPSISKAEIETLANSLEYIGEFGEKEELLKMQNNEVEQLSVSASMVLARCGVLDSFDRSLRGLLTDRAWRSNGYDKALKILAIPSMFDTLFDEAMKLDIEEDAIILSNIAEVIGAFDSDDLYKRLAELIDSENEKEIIFAVEILSNIKTERAKNELLNLMRSDFTKVKQKIIYGFRDENYKPINYKNLIECLFELLCEDSVGATAANYIYDLEDVEIAQVALDKLDSSRNDIEQINLCNIVSLIDPDKAFKILEEKINNYNSYWIDCLSNALNNLNENYPIVDYLINKLTICDADVRSVILHTIVNNEYKDQKYPVNHDSFVILFKIWEEYCGLGFDYWTERLSLEKFIGHNCFHSEKDYILHRFNDKEYKHRFLLKGIVSISPINSSDIEEVTMRWLTDLVIKGVPQFHQYKLEELLSKACNEQRLTEYILPLLNNKIDFIKSSAYKIIKRFERIVGKRYI
ncbi:SIR2 family protein [Paenibacillus sp. IB182496]|uniref:SIR2 family protein n=1 Tax=Paenibacillus sabuli TaxID=2772509 RepID=A0A927BVS3_9BACL|nr:SIR2 family protein [Paenibacillus sabuli]MBD2846409.1 SIR2 family protein [Paenibacillus sabuli]